MAKVNLVNKQIQMQLDQIIKFQLITHCYINHITVGELDLDCLVTLGKLGEAKLTDFCNNMADQKLAEKLKTWKGNGICESSPQTIRNILLKLEKFGLLNKEGKGRKTISLNPQLKIQTSGNILLNYKAIYVETKEN